MGRLPRALHGAVDTIAMWTEDVRRRAPAPFRPAAAVPLACFGPLPPPPAAPASPGVWRPPSPAPEAAGRGERMTVHVSEAAGTRRGTAVLVPPWKIGSPAIVAGWVALLRRAGLDAWLAIPPHHADRAARGARSGEGFVGPDLARLRGAVEQSVAEVRSLLRAAAARGGEVGLVGLSLGALVAALAATAPERLDFVALVAPPDLSDVLARTRIGRRYRALAARADAPLPGAADLAPMLAPLDPARRRPPAARRLVALGTYDRVVPRRGPEALARAWDVVPREYARGHLTLLFACPALRRDVAAFAAAPASAPPR